MYPLFLVVEPPKGPVGPVGAIGPVDPDGLIGAQTDQIGARNHAVFDEVNRTNML